MSLDVWAVWPTVSLERSRPLVDKWHDLGYKVACLVNPPHDHSDIPEAECVVVQNVWEGFAVAANFLCHTVPGDIVAVVGDDILPDPDRTASELGEDFLERFPDLFGVMQPIGDEFAYTHKCAVSPWIGRKFIEVAYGGQGPYWTGYFHYYADYELQLVAEKLGVFQQRKDVIQYHDHWQRQDQPKRPAHLRKAKQLHRVDKALWEKRSKEGYPGLVHNLEVKTGEQEKAWERHFVRGPGELESVNGYGSFLENTQEIREALPSLFSGYEIQTFTDIPCGDWNWMSRVDLTGVDYLGCDIVPEMVQQNQARFPQHSFQVLNLVTEVPRKSDLILCRDLLFHLSNEWVLKALANIVVSGSEWLLATSFPQIKKNEDIRMDGCLRWRPINLCAQPFSLPSPVEVIQENDSHACRGRIVGLWRVTDLPRSCHG